MEHPGYIYVFLYNRSNSANWVYFDDFKVTHQRSPIVAGADFYPFGLAMEGREITQEDYRWGYQGQYAEKDTVTNWNRFELRMYDARFGRWLSVDPYGQFASPYLAMGNMPNIYSDSDGGWSWVTAGIGFAVGAATGYAIGGDWQSALIGGFAGGLVGGASFNQGTGSATRFNGGFREYGGLSLEFNNSLYSGIGKGIGKMGGFFIENPGIITGATRSLLRNQQDDGPTQKDLNKFAKEDHPDLNKQYSSNTYWHLDKDGKYTSERKPGHTLPGNAADKNTRIDVYVHPSAFDRGPGKRYLVIGHEWIHVAHIRSGAFYRWYKQYGYNAAKNISEFHAYQWQVDQEVKNYTDLGGKAQLDLYKSKLPAGYLKK